MQKKQTVTNLAVSCIRDEKGVMISGERTHRSGPRVFYVGDGD